MSYFKTKMYQIRFRLGPTSKGRGGDGKQGEGREQRGGMGKGGKGRGGDHTACISKPL